MFERTRPPVDPVTFTLDGREIVAERGEPLAVAMLAAGESVLARSPKLHRPRGPACLRGDCDGCIARVDGVPNIMTCLRDTRGGEVVSAQNVLGSRKTDLLRITDWFFPRGIDHHHLMAGVPGVGSAMQTFARQMAGIGRLPDEPVTPVPAARSECDVLVVGGGLAGLSCVRRLADAKRSVMLVDEGAALGGSARFAEDGRALVADLGPTVEASAKVLLRSSVIGFYEGEALVVEPANAHVIRPRVLVVATGAHDGVLCVPGNDLPGVMGARAVCNLASSGIVPKDGAVVVGEGPWAERVKAALGSRVVAARSERDIASIAGRSRVRGVRTTDGASFDCSVVAVATTVSPSFQVAAQAGASTGVVDGGFAVVVDADGRAHDGVFAAGECAGVAFDPKELVASGERAARGVVAALSPR
ncbi:MAG: FAD-dependent oxidoreductase [Polyangiaceae bacterium]|nr:FAD-dependent oxidoreductase [Polyangiaceae bacterium]